MMTLKLQIVVLSFSFISMFCPFSKTNAQRLSINLSGGVSYYNGDLSVDYRPYNQGSLSGGATFDVTSRYRIRANFSQLSIHANDWRSPNFGAQQRLLSFKTNISEFALLGEIDLTDPVYHNIIPYVFGGVAVFHFNPKPFKPINGKDVNLHDIGTEGQNLSSGKYASRKYNLTQINLQYGAGVRYNFSENFSVAVEANFRKLFTDYLDDVSSARYVTDEEWDEEIRKNPSAALGKMYGFIGGSASTRPKSLATYNPNYKRGNPDKNDSYYTYQIRFNFRLQNLIFGPDMYSPSNPNGRGQLRCSRNVY